MALITPTPDVIRIFNSFWTETPETLAIPLFEGDDAIDVGELILEFQSLDEQDENIGNTEDLHDFLREINSKYHTRVRGGVDNIVAALGAHGVMTKQDLIEVVNNNQLTIPAFVDICRHATGTYTYSFATKVFCFVDNNDRFPIIDSYAATVLDAYEYEGKISRNLWGDYEQYRNNYSRFKDAFHIANTNRETDRFLWTYGKILDAYWIRQGVLRFSTISFNPDTIP